MDRARGRKNEQRGRAPDVPAANRPLEEMALYEVRPPKTHRTEPLDQLAETGSAPFPPEPARLGKSLSTAAYASGLTRGQVIQVPSAIDLSQSEATEQPFNPTPTALPIYPLRSAPTHPQVGGSHGTQTMGRHDGSARIDRLVNREDTSPDPRPAGGRGRCFLPGGTPTSESATFVLAARDRTAHGRAADPVDRFEWPPSTHDGDPRAHCDAPGHRRAGRLVAEVARGSGADRARETHRRTTQGQARGDRSQKEGRCREKGRRGRRGR